MNIKEKICVENRYSGSNWNFEKTTKYIFEVNGRNLEAGYFEHYREEELVKVVIELPQSYGCAAKCQFCASASIPEFEILEAAVMEEMFQYLYEENHLEKQKYVLLTMTGMGDIFFNYDNVEQFLLHVSVINNLFVTLSSCLWNEELLTKVKRLSGKIRIRNIQITYVTDRYERLVKLIPFYQHQAFDLERLISAIDESEEDYYRINYIVIRGINDAKTDMEKLCDRLKRVSNKVVVRIAMLNETGTTQRNHLQATDIAVLEEFHQILQVADINSYIYYAYKNDNMNCGQLITENRGK